MHFCLCYSRDGRLEEGDQILAIDGQVLDSYISHQQAIGILQKATREYIFIAYVNLLRGTVLRIMLLMTSGTVFLVSIPVRVTGCGEGVWFGLW